MKFKSKTFLKILVIFLAIEKVKPMVYFTNTYYYKLYIKKIIYLFLIQRDFDILFSKANCTNWNTNYVAEYNCNLLQLPKNRGNYISGNILFKKDITKIILDFRVNLPSVGKTDTELLKFRLNGCQLATFRANNPILSSIVKKLRSSGNFPGKCPLKAVSVHRIKTK